MRSLITGSRGFIGSHLCNFLKSKGHYVRGVDIKEECFLETKEDEFLRLDLRNPMSAIKACKDIDHVYNLSANMGGIGYIMGTVDADIMKDNVLINANMLEACRLQDVKRIFFSSSACTYPQELQLVPEVEGLKESDVLPAHPDSMYGWEKLFSEYLYKSYEKQYGLQVRIARFHNIYGPHTNWNDGAEKAPAAICRKVAMAEDGGEIEIWGDGRQTRSYTFISDCLEAIYALIQSDFSEPINIGTSDLISVDDLAKLVMNIANKKLTISHNLDKPQGVRGRNCDYTLINKILGWEPKVTLDQGMIKLYDWIERQVELGKT